MLVMLLIGWTVVLPAIVVVGLYIATGVLGPRVDTLAPSALATRMAALGDDLELELTAAPAPTVGESGQPGESGEAASAHAGAGTPIAA